MPDKIDVSTPFAQRVLMKELEERLVMDEKPCGIVLAVFPFNESTTKVYWTTNVSERDAMLVLGEAVRNYGVRNNADVKNKN